MQIDISQEDLDLITTALVKLPFHKVAPTISRLTHAVRRAEQEAALKDGVKEPAEDASTSA